MDDDDKFIEDAMRDTKKGYTTKRSLWDILTSRKKKKKKPSKKDKNKARKDALKDLSED